MTKILLIPVLAAACLGAVAVSSGAARAAIPGPSSTLVRPGATVDPVRMMRSRRMTSKRRGGAIGKKKGL